MSDITIALYLENSANSSFFNFNLSREGEKKMKKFLTFLCTVTLVLGMVGSASALPINMVAYSSLTGTGLITFDDLPGGPAPDTNYDNIFESGGADFGEHFVGQTVTYNGDFDVINGLPSGGSLSLAAGAENENLGVYSYSTNIMYGLGNTVYPNYDAIGEGSFAVLFDYDQSEFGFQLVGGDGGSATIDFYTRNGNLIESRVIASLSENYYGFSRDGGLNDIAGISIYNIDGGGIGFDNLIHDVPRSLPPYC